MNVYVTPNPNPNEKCNTAYDGQAQFQIVFDSNFMIESKAFDFTFLSLDINVPYSTTVTDQ